MPKPRLPAPVDTSGWTKAQKAAYERQRAEEEASVIAPPPTPEAKRAYEWIVAGLSESDIAEGLAHHFPGSDHNAAMLAAFDYLAEVGRADGDVVRGWCLESARELYRRAMEANDGQGALAALKFIAQIGT